MIGREKKIRGTAEIELLLVIVVLIAVMMVAIAYGRIGVARLAVISEAQYEATVNAETGDPSKYTGNAKLEEVTEEWDVRPGLPNRTHVVRKETTQSFYMGNKEKSDPIKVIGNGAAVSPDWTMGAYPSIGEDSGPTQQWFEDFISESHIDLIPPLGMQPAWKP